MPAKHYSCGTGATLWGTKKQVRRYRLSDEVPWDVVVKNTVFQSDFALDSRRVKLIAALEWFARYIEAAGLIEFSYLQ
jgi:hypothetical protein